MHSTIRAGILATIALLCGVGIGVTGAHANDHHGHVVYAGTRTTHALVEQVANDVLNNQRYAEWCGGVVRIAGTDVSVKGCDR